MLHSLWLQTKLVSFTINSSLGVKTRSSESDGGRVIPMADPQKQILGRPPYGPNFPKFHVFRVGAPSQTVGAPLRGVLLHPLGYTTP